MHGPLLKLFSHLALLMLSGYLINIVRGAHNVEDDLLKLVNSGHIAGACLDVLRTEPAPVGNPFRAHPCITLTPRISAITLLKPSIAKISQK